MAVEKLRFYLDENIPIAIADQLRSRGIDVVTVRDLGLLGDEDDNHLQRATASGRVLCTHDSDFVKLASEGVNHAGIVFGQQDQHRIGEWVKYLELLHSIYSSGEMLNIVEYLSS